MLDTDICIYIIKRIKQPTYVFSLKQREGLSISSVTLAELAYGVEASDYYDKNLSALQHFLSTVSILPFHDDAAMVYGNIHALLKRKGRTIGPLDMLIAAHAKSEGLILVTNNVREFNRVEGLKIENWTEESQ